MSMCVHTIQLCRTHSCEIRQPADTHRSWRRHRGHPFVYRFFPSDLLFSRPLGGQRPSTGGRKGGVLKQGRVSRRHSNLGETSQARPEKKRITIRSVAQRHTAASRGQRLGYGHGGFSLFFIFFVIVLGGGRKRRPCVAHASSWCAMRASLSAHHCCPSLALSFREGGTRDTLVALFHL